MFTIKAASDAGGLLNFQCSAYPGLFQESFEGVVVVFFVAEDVLKEFSCCRVVLFFGKLDYLLVKGDGLFFGLHIITYHLLGLAPDLDVLRIKRELAPEVDGPLALYPISGFTLRI